MSAWRAAYGVALFLAVGVPLLMPLGELHDAAAWSWTAQDAKRHTHLTLNSISLVAGTVAISLPLGIALAVLLFRTTFVGRDFAFFLIAVALFVPLPVIVSSWQGTLGAHGLLPIWSDAEGRPWASGMGAAIWIHALAATPWGAFIVGVGLTWVEAELEDEAAQFVGPWRVLMFVTLPRVRASILASAVFVALQTAAETSVTEMMLVPTLAEEMRTQFATTNAGLGRTLVLSLPSLILIWAMAIGVLAYLQKALPPLALPFSAPRPMELGTPGTRLSASLVVIAFLWLPVASLIWKLGLTGHPPHWQGDVASQFLRAEAHLLGGELIASLVTSVLTGIGVAVTALTGCWLARDSRAFRWLLFGVVTWIWVLPGPAIGMALKQAIDLLPDGPWKALLYYGPSPAPLIWAQGMRALPIAVVFLWPIVRLIPRELFEEARLGGAGPFSELLHVVLPATWRAAAATAIAAAALCLGEIGASARVETPGWQSFAKTLLDHMHTGLDNNVAALCLMMLAAIIACAALVWLATSFVRRTSITQR